MKNLEKIKIIFLGLFLLSNQILFSQIDNKRYLEYSEKYNSEHIKYSLDSIQLSQDEKLRICRICWGYDPCDSMPSLSCINFSYNSNDSIAFKTNHFEVHIKSIKFKRINHSICREQDMFLEIDNQVVYGTWLEEMPRTELYRFEVLYRSKKIEFSKSHWSNFYNPNIRCTNSTLGLYCQIEVFYDKAYNNLYVSLSGADGANGYSVLFVFKGGKYVGKVIYM